jgi:hypothetical protein
MAESGERTVSRLGRSVGAISVVVAIGACGSTGLERTRPLELADFSAAEFGPEVEEAARRFSEEILHRYSDASSYEDVVADLESNGFVCRDSVRDSMGEPTIHCIAERPRFPMYRDKWIVIIRDPARDEPPRLVALYRIQAP